MMAEGDNLEPPILYSGNVLRTAKYEAKKKKYRDSNPIISVEKFKTSAESENAVRDIGLHPVVVHFWSQHQIRLYNELRKKEHLRLCIDATGGIAKKVTHIDGKLSQHIFLYSGVVYCSFGEFAVFSMFSELQDTVTISTWLRRWLQSGVKFPKEAVCDSSKALLNACCWTFTGYDTVKLYAEACMSDQLPRTYIRIDVAHYLKNWSDFLAFEKKPVKRFYMFGIGQIIMSVDKVAAEEIIDALFIISLSETSGNCTTSLKEAVTFVKSLADQETMEAKEINDMVDATESQKPDDWVAEEEDDEDCLAATDGILKSWADAINSKVEERLRSEKGDDINPRYCPKFAKRLLKQIETIPLWSCVRRNEFGYGRIPASSAPVESEFKTIKKQVLTETTRIDLAVESLIKYYNGKLKIIDCSVQSKSSKCKEQFDQHLTFQQTIARVRNHVELSESDESNKENTFEAVNDVSISSEIGHRTMIYYHVQSERSPLKNISQYYQIATTCISCKIGNYPEGAHICILCKCAVHPFEGCSIAIEGEEEGYEERRLCMQCSESSAKEERLAFQEGENWRNLGREAKKKRNKCSYLYRGNQNLIDIITSSTCTTLPIIKNGSFPGLAYVTVGKAKITFLNTCALDSIILSAVSDDEKMRTYVENRKEDNPLYGMVLEAADGKYKKRGEILLNFLKKKPSPRSIEVVDCQCNVVSLVNFLFKAVPSFQEKLVCPAGCQDKINTFPTVTITAKTNTVRKSNRGACTLEGRQMS